MINNSVKNEGDDMMGEQNQQDRQQEQQTSVTSTSASGRVISSPVLQQPPLTPPPISADPMKSQSQSPVSPSLFSQSQPVPPSISYPSLMNLPNSSARPKSPPPGTSGGGGGAHRFDPYHSNSVSLTFNEKWEMVEQIVSMFPLLEKDPIVYNTLQKYNWVVDACLNDFQKRHDLLERRAKQRQERFNDMTSGLNPKKDRMSMEESGEYEVEENLDDPSSDDDPLEKLEFEDGEEMNKQITNLDETEQDESMMTDSGNGNPTNPSQQALKPGHPSALQFSRYPQLREHIQTLKDIFGNAYHDFELKSFYVVCNGNLELTIDQIVNDQIKINESKPPVNPQVNTNEERKPITERLTEDEKRTIQMQLIEEQEKLEKKFSDKKKEEVKNHPGKKNFSQQEIVNELKDLFGKVVDEGVIEWVAYRCDYDLGNSVTQLVDIKHNSLLKKGTLSPPVVDMDTQNQIQKNLEILGKQNLASVGVNVDNFADEISKKLIAVDHSSGTGNDDKINNTNMNNNNNSVSPNNIFFKGLTSMSTTTTTTTTSTNTGNSPPNPVNNINPFFTSTFTYNSNSSNNNKK